VIETIEQDNLLQRAQELGQRFYQGFSKALDGVAGVQEIRVKGLMIGIELDRSSGQLMTKALFRQILINVAAERVVRLLPPLIISDAQADDIIATVSHLIVEFLNLPA